MRQISAMSVPSRVWEEAAVTEAQPGQGVLPAVSARLCIRTATTARERSWGEVGERGGEEKKKREKNEEDT